MNWKTSLEGIEVVGQETKMRFLRRIPVDPMTHDDWELRSYQDDVDATSWGGGKRLRCSHQL